MLEGYQKPESQPKQLPLEHITLFSHPKRYVYVQNNMVQIMFCLNIYDMYLIGEM